MARCKKWEFEQVLKFRPEMASPTRLNLIPRFLSRLSIAEDIPFLKIQDRVFYIGN